MKHIYSGYVQVEFDPINICTLSYLCMIMWEVNMYKNGGNVDNHLSGHYQEFVASLTQPLWLPNQNAYMLLFQITTFPKDVYMRFIYLFLFLFYFIFLLKKKSKYLFPCSPCTILHRHTRNNSTLHGNASGLFTSYAWEGQICGGWR